MPSGGVTGPIIRVHPSPLAERLALVRAQEGEPSVRLRGPRQIFAQGNTECCVSCAVSTCLEIVRSDYPRLSAVFHYHVSRKAESNAIPSPATGMQMSTGVNTLKERGICIEACHNNLFTREGIEDVPEPDALRDALARALPDVYDPVLKQEVAHVRDIGLGYDPVNECKSALRQGAPILVCVFQTQTYIDMLNNGRSRLTSAGNGIGRRHAVAFIGYDDHESSFIVQDSRGRDRFAGGQWWLHYNVLTSNPTLVSEAYAIHGETS